MDERYIAAVDLGTSKIAVTVAQISSKGVQMLYYRESPSEGIRNSYVFNPQKAAEKVKAALADAEEELKIKIHQVVTGLPRYEVSQVNARAEFERSDGESSITREEIDFLKNNAIDTYPLPDPEKQIMYGVVAQSFTTEEYLNARESDIEGMVSDTLEGNFKVFVGRKRHSDNVDRVMNLVGVAVAKKYFLPEITAGAILSDEERENGVALIEIGAGATSVTIYHNDIMRYYSSIPFGGKSITNDIKLECGTSESLAENIKLGYGACMPEKILTLRDKIIQINNRESGSCKQLSVKYLSEVITCRVREIVDACLYKIQESGFGGNLRNGIVLTGGSAVIPNLSTYVKELSGYNIRIGYPRQKFSYVGCPEINDTSAVASVGMVMAAKDNKYLNCLSEPPARYDEEEEVAAAAPEEPVEDVYVPSEEPVYEPVEETPDDAGQEEGKEEKESGIWARLKEKDEQRRQREAAREEARRKKEEKKANKTPRIVWKNPFDALTKKVGSAVGRIIDDGYDGMEE
ncbi:MAG: cell division protein FtsA [Bacteroidales bacterium]|nr:cell division protein FtsA [Bacteroidales bacterium]